MEACVEDGRCKMNIRIAVGMRDRWNWEQFYDQGIAVVGMCVRTGKRGGAFNLGGFFLFGLIVGDFS